MQCTMQCATQCTGVMPPAWYCMPQKKSRLFFLRPVPALQLPQATLTAVERQGRARRGRAAVAPAAAMHARAVAAAVVPAKPRVVRVAYAAQPESVLARGAGLGLGVG